MEIIPTIWYQSGFHYPFLKHPSSVPAEWVYFVHWSFVGYGVAYYSFFLPVLCVLHMRHNFVQMRNSFIQVKRSEGEKKFILAFLDRNEINNETSFIPPEIM